MSVGNANSVFPIVSLLHPMLKLVKPTQGTTVWTTGNPKGPSADSDEGLRERCGFNDCIFHVKRY